MLKNRQNTIRPMTEINHEHDMSISRREMLRTVIASIGFAAIPCAHGEETGSEVGCIPVHPKNPSPRWYGVNLLEYFSTDPDWMKYFPYRNDGMFQEDDFRWMRDWGFAFARLPMDYRFWTDTNNHAKIDERRRQPCSDQ